MEDRRAPREIRVLSASVVNKIAAGEVIERPASVVKELMENSVDAGAERVDVTIEKGGIELIRVTDDGCGMRADQLSLAVTSHATSKIESADDLFRVRSLGFRGEALASIAEVSHFYLKSRTHAEPGGNELEVIGGDAQPIAPCGAPVGTTIEVRNLFFNTPVRRRYLRTSQTESGHITEAFTRIALAYPAVHFRLVHNNRTIHDLPPADNWKDRIGHFFGMEIRESLIAVSSEDADVRLTGYVVDPSQSRAHNRMQYLFLNGRAIRDRALQHALSEGYRGLLLTGRFPIAFLKLEMPADAVDVNVHPCKMEVRLQEGGRIYSQLLSAIRQQFLSTDLTAKVGNEGQRSASDESTGPPSQSRGDDSFQSRRDEIKAWATGKPSDSTVKSPAPWEEHSTRRPSDASWSAHQPTKQQTMDLRSHDNASSSVGWDWNKERQNASSSATTFGQIPANKEGTPESIEGDDKPVRFASDIGSDEPPTDRVSDSNQRIDAAQASVGEPRYRRLQALQVQNRYLVTEDEHGMVVIDQHALHERILYEEIREKVLAGKLETQKLLVPEPITLAPAEAAAVMEQRELLKQIGIEVEPFGGDSLLVTSYPAMLAKRSPSEILRNLIEELLVDGKIPEKRDVLDELLHLLSCKAAVKAGDRLSSEEIEALLEHRELCQDAHHCPHGRPTALVFSREELDRRFKRI